MRFTGDIFHPGDFRMAMAQLLQVAFFGGMALSMFGKGMLPPAVGNFMSENAMLTFGVLFSCNVMSGKLINTGAFEMSYNGTPVWSKLETGRFPSLEAHRAALRRRPPSRSIRPRARAPPASRLLSPPRRRRAAGSASCAAAEIPRRRRGGGRRARNPSVQ